MLRTRTFGYVVVRENLHDGSKSTVTGWLSLRAAEERCQQYSDHANDAALPYVYTVSTDGR